MSMKRWRIGAVLVALVCGCSSDSSRAGRGAAADAEPPSGRAFSLTLTSSIPSRAEPLGARPEFHAAADFDHQVTKSGEKVVVRQRALGRTFEVNDPAQRAALEALVARADWAKKKAAAGREMPPDGGKVVNVSLDRGGHTTDFQTFNASSDPDLTELMALLQSISGYPKR